MSDQSNQTTFWKSLNELAKNKEYEKYAEREFPENATEMTDQVSRRSFLRVMGASIALAGFASCRKPVQKILPYSKQPEDLVLGEPNFYATSMPFQDTVTGLLVENNEGRPTKLEGNDQHPASGGRTNIYNQAGILNLYDPDRSRSPRRNGESVSKEDFIQFASEHFSDRNRNILFVSEANSSPTYNRVKENALQTFSNANWVTFEPFNDDNVIEGTNIAFGRRLRTVNHYDEADVVVSLNDDFMSPYGHKNSVENAYKLTARRKVNSTDDSMSRIYSVENSFSSTGSYADHRLRLKTSEIEPFTYALASRLSESVSGLGAFGNVSNGFTNHEWVDKLADDLLSNQGSSIVSLGFDHSSAAHAAVAAINSALKNAGNTVTYHEIPHYADQHQTEAFLEAMDEMKAGVYDTVVLIGTNPVYAAPSDLDFATALGNVDTKIHLSDYYDETSRVADWHVNRAHFLEAWGDGLSYTGQRSVIQPQILPLYDSLSEIEFLNTIVSGEESVGYDLVQETWRGYFSSNFNQNWETVLHDGVDPNSGFSSVDVSLRGGFASDIRPNLNAEPISGMEITIKPDATLFDGRFANNGWLQELPEPMTKITWDNVALMSPSTAESLGLPPEQSFKSNEVPTVRISAGDTTIEIAAWVLPGHADNSITLTTGYGRNNLGRVADGVGVDVYPLRTSEAMFNQPASVERTGSMYEIACVQDHNNIEGRDMVREATLEEYRENPDFATYKSIHGYEVPGMKEALAEGDERGPISLFEEQYGPDYQPQWGMAIDLNACFGCGVCTIACQAENNIPVIGKREVGRRRIMHWIRTDRYFEGDRDNPKVYHQPVPCMHCELAPCEQVCPVAATTHSEDGMNQMTYNRCIGTRYCANNCPFKVRRFNFFNYTKEYLTTGDDPEIIQMAMNPDVTVRFRGVIEKCSYCVQRVNSAKIKSKIATGSKKPEDGAVQTACQQACPANAITFGDLTDQNSVVSQHKQNDRNYVMLEEMNVRPRTSYLAKLRNTNSELA
ncbi:TAT-variant-translocated molybdopterin oxidoreductase [Rhodohalobacter sp.]|uniref:TAT-variant-translocated molybdopterin oxidoreductase n=1 Tax=Rhodohalobacter sp. TaxID=1974210 RepID=UPI002ACDFDEA|nr:TAT-variant-translocated molybdopterin oxidoreductase [Rhodohalobacter sp.]MDZ7757810.1 TAT-variant-translocated molybdopterin oxidoreductase [Rhodohalobacter sp.]